MKKPNKQDLDRIISELREMQAYFTYKNSKKILEPFEMDVAAPLIDAIDNLEDVLDNLPNIRDNVIEE